MKLKASRRDTAESARLGDTNSSKLVASITSLLIVRWQINSIKLNIIQTKYKISNSKTTPAIHFFFYFTGALVGVANIKNQV